MLSYFTRGERPCELILYIFYSLRKDKAYSTLWSFKHASLFNITTIATSFIVVVFLIPIFVLSLSHPELFEGINAVAIYISSACITLFRRTVSDINRCMERERLFTYLCASGMRPLSEQPE